MPNDTILTGIDALVKYLNEHDETDTATLSSKLNASEKTVEDWANVLEKARLIKVTYKLGKMYLSRLGREGKGGENEAKQIMEVQKTVAEQELESDISYINKLEEKIDSLSRVVKSAENTFRTRASDIKRTLDKVDALQSKLTKDYKDIKSRRDYINKVSESLNSDLATLSANQQKLKSFVLDTGDANQTITGIKNKIKEAEEAADGIKKKADANISSQRNIVKSIYADIKSENKILENIAYKQEHQINDYKKRTISYKKDAESKFKNIEKNRVQTTDKINKIRSDAERTYLVMQDQVNKANSIFLQSKKNFGEFSLMYDKLAQIKNDLAIAMKDKQEIKKEIVELIQKIKEIRTATSVNDTVSLIKIKELQDSSGKVAERLDKTDKSIAKIRKNIEDLAA